MDIPPPPGPYASGPHQHPQPYPGPYGPPGQPPYGPQGQPPYQQWPGPYSPYSRPPVNGFAIASLVFGILCCIPGIGLILGLVGLSQIKKKGERGKGLAIAGSILSALGVVLLVIGVTTGAARDFVDGFREAARESRSGSFPVDKGGCFNVPDSDLDSATYEYEIDEVPCARPHDAEVFASFRVNNPSFPGDAAVQGLAERKCTAFATSYTEGTSADLSGAEVVFFVPDRETWRQGSRHITCLYAAADQSRSLEGSLRGDGTGGRPDGDTDGDTGGGADGGADGGDSAEV
ncbi:DUF4190 domain-containing protein [Streptomyces formicae]|uniref:DUF4190 domain-containing protein n=1 Tax=Streptomyces formicae TaxID=1616117 RepID=A0A291QFF0_9ACTN|nr:DUF4190 domain-containing protein [Streptomyces formicae]ATL30204.1 hypothetical protein KY5_5186 [Streptomyces formicae]